MSALTDFFTALANKIRTNLGTETEYTTQEMISAVDSVYDKGKNDGIAQQSKTVVNVTDMQDPGMNGLFFTVGSDIKTVSFDTQATTLYWILLKNNSTVDSGRVTVQNNHVGLDFSSQSGDTLSLSIGEGYSFTNLIIVTK